MIYSYFLATTLYPEVEKKAHAEIDSVIGRDRLPGYEDRASLPYVNAICKELLRWLPIVPLAVPHRATRDIIFDDYSIPEGSLVCDIFCCLSIFSVIDACLFVRSWPTAGSSSTTPMSTGIHSLSTLTGTQSPHLILLHHRKDPSCIMIANQLIGFHVDPVHVTVVLCRFMGPEPEQDPADFCFGFGRR